MNVLAAGSVGVTNAVGSVIVETSVASTVAVGGNDVVAAPAPSELVDFDLFSTGIVVGCSSNGTSGGLLSWTGSTGSTGVTGSLGGTSAPECPPVAPYWPTAGSRTLQTW